MFLQFVFGLLLATLMIEAGLRITEVGRLWKALPIANYLPTEPDPHIAFAHVPDSEGFWINENRSLVRFNNHGLHDRDRTAEPPAGMFRVGVLGDSMVEALQVDQATTFTAQAEVVLEEAAEVINLGLSNAHQAVQIERWRQVGAAMNIDALVVVMSAVHDEGYSAYPIYRDDTVLPAYRQDDAGEWSISTKFTSSPDYRFFSNRLGRLLVVGLEHSRVARLVFNRWKTGLWREWRQGGGSNLPTEPTCKDISFDAQWRLWVQEVPNLANGRLNAYLNDLVEIGQTHNVPVVLLMLGPLYDCPYSLIRAPEFESAVIARTRSYDIDVRFAATEMRNIKPTADVRAFFGFGVDIGNGHLNTPGHKIMSTVLASIILTLMPQNTQIQPETEIEG